jgi:hypothetical protein
MCDRGDAAIVEGCPYLFPTEYGGCTRIGRETAVEKSESHEQARLHRKRRYVTMGT